MPLKTLKLVMVALVAVRFVKVAFAAEVTPKLTLPSTKRSPPILQSVTMVRLNNLVDLTLIAAIISNHPY
jgi:hypothetical protein